MRLVVVMFAMAAASALGPGERPLEPGSGQARRASWVLLKHNLEMTVWLDTARIQPHPSDSSMDVWLRYVAAGTTPISSSPRAPRFKTLDFEATVRCGDQVVRPATGVFYDSTGALIDTLAVRSAGGGQREIRDALQTALPRLCNWLMKARLVPSPRR